MSKPAAPKTAASLLDCVKPLLHSRKAEMTLGEIVERIECKGGPGPVLFVLTLPVLLPTPPGVSMIMALPLLVVAPQIMIGRQEIWMPKWLARRKVKRADLVKVLKRVTPLVKKAEDAVHPRFRFLTGRVGACAVGAVCTLIAIVLVLPLPFANLVPAIAMSVFAIGLARRDGGFVLAGYGLVLVAGALIAAGAHGAAVGVGHLKSLF